jgi:uncharacterized protein YjbJ (UPF0337 family)
MDHDGIAGSVQRVRGAAKATAGDVVGDAKLQVEGSAERAAGILREAVGRAKDAADEAAETPGAEVRHLREEVQEISAEAAADEARAEATPAAPTPPWSGRSTRSRPPCGATPCSRSAVPPCWVTFWGG